MYMLCPFITCMKLIDLKEITITVKVTRQMCCPTACYFADALFIWNMLYLDSTQMFCIDEKHSF
jgi:hypothetical protein